MQNQTYDEDLSANKFFNSIQNHQNGELFRKSVEEGWIICVPKASVLSSYPIPSDNHEDQNLRNSENAGEFNQKVLMRHVLIPNDELPESHYNTLEGNEVVISGSSICLKIVNVGEFRKNHMSLLTMLLHFDTAAYFNYKFLVKYKLFS